VTFSGETGFPPPHRCANDPVDKRRKAAAAADRRPLGAEFLRRSARPDALSLALGRSAKPLTWLLLGRPAEAAVTSASASPASARSRDVTRSSS
jgi:hypothetical protein